MLFSGCHQRIHQPLLHGMSDCVVACGVSPRLRPSKAGFWYDCEADVRLSPNLTTSRDCLLCFVALRILLLGLFDVISFKAAFMKLLKLNPPTGGPWDEAGRESALGLSPKSLQANGFCDVSGCEFAFGISLNSPPHVGL